MKTYFTRVIPTDTQARQDDRRQGPNSLGQWEGKD